MTGVQLRKDRDLLDPNFSGYKLSLESVSVSSVEVPASCGAEHQQPQSGEYGYLHAKLYGEHNHLTVDPWAGGVYWLSGTGEAFPGLPGTTACWRRSPEPKQQQAEQRWPTEISRGLYCASHCK